LVIEIGTNMLVYTQIVISKEMLCC